MLYKTIPLIAAASTVALAQDRLLEDGSADTSTTTTTTTARTFPSILEDKQMMYILWDQRYDFFWGFRSVEEAVEKLSDWDPARSRLLLTFCYGEVRNAGYHVDTEEVVMKIIPTPRMMTQDEFLKCPSEHPEITMERVYQQITECGENCEAWTATALQDEPFLQMIPDSFPDAKQAEAVLQVAAEVEKMSDEDKASFKLLWISCSDRKDDRIGYQVNTDDLMIVFPTRRTMTQDDFLKCPDESTTSAP